MVESRLKNMLPSLLLAMIATALAPFSAQAQDVTYLDANGAQQTLADGSYTVVTDQTEWASGWYVVNSDVTIASRITATGDVHLVLMDGVTFNPKAGVTVNYDENNNNALTIYAQSTGNNVGKLRINNPTSQMAGIGGSNRSCCGVVTVNGGDLDIMSGSYAAAIGSGDSPSNIYNNGVVVINGGNLVLRSNSYGAGIGGGEYADGGTITINGGTITATGGIYSAALGGSDGSNGGTITINGGTLDLTGGRNSSAIGGGGHWSGNPGSGGQSGTITINGGNITATGTDGAPAIGASHNANIPGEADVIRLSWTNNNDRYETKGGGYEARSVTILKPFNIESTGARATLADLQQPTAIIPVQGTIHTVTYMVDSEIHSQLSVLEGDCAENLKYEPSDRLFDAWYKDGASEPWDFTQPVMQDLVLVAHFKTATLNADETGAYLIGTAEEWDIFTVLVNSGEKGAKAKLTANITEPVTRMVENEEFNGSFDGQDYTLTVNYDSYEAYVAPFRYTLGATIQNLKVAGTITQRNRYCAGIVGRSKGTTITNCVSSVTFDSKVTNYAYIGGFVAHAAFYTTTLTNCIFDGKLLGNNTNHCGGFIGHNESEVSLNYCYFVPEEITIATSQCHTLCRNLRNYDAVNNCYYTKPLGTVAGTFMAQMIPAMGVTVGGTPTLSHKGKDYYGDGAAIDLNFDLPEGKFFDRYTVDNGEITNPFAMTGEHVVSGFTQDVTITGSYVDSKTDIANASIDAIPDQTYSKVAIEPELHITCGDAVLVKGNDYTVQYSDNLNAGIATVVVTGCGLYDGTATLNFNILQRDINDEAITTMFGSKHHVTGEVIHPAPTIKYGDRFLSSITDYDLAYSGECINVGDYSLTVTGKGNYTGILELPFSIIGDITYLNYADGSFTEAVCSDYQVLYDQSSISSGWWVVAEDLTFDKRFSVSGDVHLILMDGVTFNPKKGVTLNHNYGEHENSLTIYAQSEGEGMGKLLIDKPEMQTSGLGGGSYGRSCGAITINGGDLDIKGGDGGAAIGSGYGVGNSGPNYGSVTINGGKLLLRSSGYGAGIGGGEYTDGGTITINGGDITAYGGYHSAGIGGSDGKDGGVITINGGTINATGGSCSPGIGGADYWSTSDYGGQSGTININGGNITAASTEGSVAIGATSENPKAPTENDVININWSSANDSYTANGTYSSGAVNINNTFVLDGTYTLATTENIDNATIVAAALINIAADIEHGTVEADKSVCPVGGGEIVTLTITPDDGYELDELIIEEAPVVNNEPAPEPAPRKAPMKAAIEYNKVDNSTYTFEMPASPVNVTATFKKATTGIEGILQNANAKSVRYYNIQGIELQEPAKGVNIVVIENKDGTTSTVKVYNK